MNLRLRGTFASECEEFKLERTPSRAANAKGSQPKMCVFRLGRGTGGGRKNKASSWQRRGLLRIAADVCARIRLTRHNTYAVATE